MGSQHLSRVRKVGKECRWYGMRIRDHSGQEGVMGIGDGDGIPSQRLGKVRASPQERYNGRDRLVT